MYFGENALSGYPFSVLYLQVLNAMFLGQIEGYQLARGRKFICSIARRLVLNESDNSYCRKVLTKKITEYNGIGCSIGKMHTAP